MPEYMEGDTVESGSILVDWSIRIFFDADGTPSYDWIIDDGRGGYDESDCTYKTIDEAMKDLGVR